MRGADSRAGGGPEHPLRARPAGIRDGGAAGAIGRPTVGVARHRSGGRLDALHGVVFLAGVPQPTGSGRHAGPDSLSLPERRQTHRSRHQQSGSAAAAVAGHRAGLVVAAVPTGKQVGPVVRKAVRDRRETDAASGNRGPGPQVDDRVVEVPRVGRGP